MAGRTILVVDDEDDIREITKLTLELTGGWEVLDADRGAAALTMAVEQLPDVVLLDVMMPDMDGPTTLAHLKADPTTSHIPVVLLTAKVQTGLRGGWGSLPVAGVIPKPFDPMTLSDEIDRLVADAD